MPQHTEHTSILISGKNHQKTQTPYYQAKTTIHLK